MKKSSLIEAYMKYASKDTLKLTKDELLQILQDKIDIIDQTSLRIFVDKILSAEYKETIQQHAKSIKGKVEKIMKLIHDFESSKTDVAKYKAYKEIVKFYEKEEDILIDDYLPEKLVQIIEYGFKIEDVHSCALLMKKRKEMRDCISGTDTTDRYYGYADSLHALDLYKPFIKMAVDQCDKATALKYIREMTEGKYFKLGHETERWGWHLSESEIMSAFKSYEESKSTSSPV